MTTRSGRVETVEELQARIHQVARHLPLERLALSPQCGFATSILGNALTPADQKAKLCTIVATAERVWGWRLSSHQGSVMFHLAFAMVMLSR